MKLIRLGGHRGENLRRLIALLVWRIAEREHDHLPDSKARLPRHERLWTCHLHWLVRAVCLWNPAPMLEVLRHSSLVRREDAEVGVRFQLELHDPRVHRH